MVTSDQGKTSESPCSPRYIPMHMRGIDPQVLPNKARNRAVSRVVP